MTKINDHLIPEEVATFLIANLRNDRDWDLAEVWAEMWRAIRESEVGVTLRSHYTGADDVVFSLSLDLWQSLLVEPEGLGAEPDPEVSAETPEVRTPVNVHDIRVGDTIAATLDDLAIHVGQVKRTRLWKELYLETDHGLALSISAASEHGFRFERMGPPAPTGDGLYEDREGELWLIREGKVYETEVSDYVRASDGLPALLAPYTKLEA